MNSLLTQSRSQKFFWWTQGLVLSGLITQISSTILAAETVSPSRAAKVSHFAAVNPLHMEQQQVSLKSAFSENPTDEEFFRVRVFAEPLVPLGKTSVEENKALAIALDSFLCRQESDDVSALVQFLEQNPGSAWQVSLLTDLGIVYRRTGRFSRALSAWEQAWHLGKNATGARSRAITDLAVGELAELNARLGRYDRLESLFSEIKGRKLRGPGTEKVAGAERGLWMMKTEPWKCFRCGPFALGSIMGESDPQAGFHQKIRESRSSTNGTSLVQVSTLAKELGINYQIAKRAPKSKIIVPAVVHWRAGHYAALLKENNGRYLVKDPTFTDDLWISAAALDDEASGYFLIPSGVLPQGWQGVADEEGATVWGKGYTFGSDPNSYTPYDEKVPECPNQDTPMAQYAFHTMLASLNIIDTPISYYPPRGPAVRFRVTYNQREFAQPANFPYSNLGDKWTFDWLAYLVLYSSNEGADITYYVQGGGNELYAGYNYSTSSYKPQQESRAVLVRLTEESYERRLPDGSKQIFNAPDGAAYPQKIFLTQEIDPSGNTLAYHYDGSSRVVAVVDALGQTNTVSYDLAEDSLKITRVTDAFGRFATFDYALLDEEWKLVKITDPAGITSEFTYSGDFIDSLKTPYGTTTFSKGQEGYQDIVPPTMVRWVQATDPLGQTERVEYHDGAGAIAPSNSVALVPSGMATWNNYLDYRNSFYWDKKAWPDYPDVTKAHIYHFLHTVGFQNTSGILESEKAPLEGRIWRNYGGQTHPAEEGTNASPTKIGRVLDDGTTQLYQYEYNALGRVIKYIDPHGRATTNIYSTNLIDLLEVRQIVGTNQQTLARFSYSTNHLPITAVDAAGKTNYFGYNGHGQLIASTNALNETMTLQYDAKGFLTNVIGALSNATTSFTYDSANRVRTTTDSEGYTVTLDYDDLDRVTKITYPDETDEQIVYEFLDPVLRKDRRGHWTRTSYDALRRVTEIQDSLNRITRMNWCGCGSLESIIDPLGRVTTWNRDLQGRVTSKVYPDLTQTIYSYETNTSRLKSMTDAMSQVTLYQYLTNDALKQVSYSNAVVATPSVSFTYDTNYNRVLTMTDGIGTTTYSYYTVTNGQLGAGKLASVDGPLANDTITYFYDELGRVTNRAINGVAQTVAFDALGRVTVVTNALGSFTNTYIGATARVSTNFYPNGQQAAFSYLDAANDFRLQEIRHSTLTSNLSTFSYTYDPDGQIKTWTQQADTGTPKVIVLDYDPVDQLLGATVRSNTLAGAILKQFVYGYDKMGNRTSEQIQNAPDAVPAIASAFHNDLNQLTNLSGGGPLRFRGSLNETGTVQVAGSAAFMSDRTNFQGYASVTAGMNTVRVTATDLSNNTRTNDYEVVVTNMVSAQTLQYDLNGNLTNDGNGLVYEYDAVNRTTAIVRNTTNRTEFFYDGKGRRVQVIEKQNGISISTNKYVWSGSGLCEERNDTGGLVTKRFFGQGEQIAGANFFLTLDHLGSVREVTDDMGAVRARYDYDPYGRRTKISGDVEADFGYTGHFVLASQSEHTFTLYRVYRPDFGRWISRDPLSEYAGLNLYAYAGSNPINYIDPFGLDEGGGYGASAFPDGPVTSGAKTVVKTGLAVAGVTGTVLAVKDIYESGDTLAQETHAAKKKWQDDPSMPETPEGVDSQKTEIMNHLQTTTGAIDKAGNTVLEQLPGATQVGIIEDAPGWWDKTKCFVKNHFTPEPPKPGPIKSYIGPDGKSVWAGSGSPPAGYTLDPKLN